MVASMEDVIPPGPKRTAAQRMSGRNRATGTWGNSGSRPEVPRVVREGHEGDRPETDGQERRLELPSGGRAPDPRPGGGHCHDDGRRDGELGEDIREEARPPHEPVRLALERRHEPRVQERRGERGEDTRPRDEDEDPPQGVEPRGLVAPAAHATGGEEGLAAVGREERQDQRHRPQSRRRLGQKMRRERRQQVQPPPADGRQQERGGQDGVRRPEHRGGQRAETGG